MLRWVCGTTCHALHGTQHLIFTLVKVINLLGKLGTCLWNGTSELPNENAFKLLLIPFSDWVIPSYSLYLLLQCLLVWPQRFQSVCTLAISPAHKAFIAFPLPPHHLWLQKILNVHLACFLTLTFEHSGQALNHYHISSYPWHTMSNWSQLSIIMLSLYGFRSMRSFLINLKFFDKITFKIDIDRS